MKAMCKRILTRCGGLLALLALGMALVRLASPARVIVTWETASEIDTAGFLLYRADAHDGPFSLLTATPIPASGDSLAGGSYRYEDYDVKWGQRYFYQLEEIERGGARNRFPHIVEGRAGLGWPWVLAGGALLAALGGAAGWLLSRGSRGQGAANPDPPGEVLQPGDHGT